MEEPKTQDHTLNLFKAISSFVTNLNECYGPVQKTLQLYARLISKTTLVDEAPIKRHIDAFQTFCNMNKEAILEKNNAKFVEERISYNERVYIDMAQIFRKAQTSEKRIIWQHLLSICALVDPRSKAKETLKDFINNNNTEGGKEEEFLSDIFDRVGTNIESEGNPLQAVGNLMSSGLFTDIVGTMSSGLESGDLDLGKLMGSMQGMVAGIGNMANQDGRQQNPEMEQMLGQMNAMMSNLNKMTQQATNGSTNTEDMKQGEEFAKQMMSAQSENITPAIEFIESVDEKSDTTVTDQQIEDTDSDRTSETKSTRTSETKSTRTSDRTSETKSEKKSEKKQHKGDEITSTVEEKTSRNKSEKHDTREKVRNKSDNQSDETIDTIPRGKRKNRRKKIQ